MAGTIITSDGNLCRAGKECYKTLSRMPGERAAPRATLTPIPPMYLAERARKSGQAPLPPVTPSCQVPGLVTTPTEKS